MLSYIVISVNPSQQITVNLFLPLLPPLLLHLSSIQPYKLICQNFLHAPPPSQQGYDILKVAYWVKLK